MAAEKLDTEIRREQIAEAALDLLGTRGVKELSMAGVGRQVGLVPAGIYRHFAGKDGVLDAVVELIGQRLAANVHLVREETNDAMERLHRLLVRHVRFIQENRAVPRIIFSDEMVSGNPKRKARVYQIIRGYLDHVSQIVREGQRSGAIRAELNPKVVSMLLLGIVLPGAVLWNLSSGQFDVSDHAEQAWDLFRESISSETKRTTL